MGQPDLPQQRFQGLHHQFVASAKAVQLAHEIDPQVKVGNMMIYSASYPLTCNPDDVLKNQAYNHMKNLVAGEDGPAVVDKVVNHLPRGPGVALLGQTEGHLVVGGDLLPQP